jgi:mono/diheme cytochrome c family protein
MKRIGLIGGAIGIAALAGWMLWPGGAEPVAPGGMARAMTSTQMAGVAEGGAIVVPRVPEQFSADQAMGKRAFEAKCAACHGENGAGIRGAAPPLVHKIYEPSHHGDFAFALAVKNGVRAHHWPFGDMPPVQGLTDADVAVIVAYVRALQRENGIN